MGDRTGIEWTDATWNPTLGCSRISPGCQRCYAEVQAQRIVRMGKGKPTAYDDLVKIVNGEARWTGVLRLAADRLDAPLRWKKPRRVFVNSMSDLFHEKLTNEQIAAVFGVMGAAPRHTFQVLTKRAQRMRDWFAWIQGQGLHPWTTAMLNCDAGPLHAKAITGLNAVWPLPNVWLGTSVENQAAADERIPELLEAPAAVRFLSCEPLLGPITLPIVHVFGSAPPPPSIHWVIAGCESGPGARRAEVDWYRSLRDQCADAGVAFFLKQAVEDDPTGGCGIHGLDGAPDDMSHRKPGGVIGAPYLDGRQHLEWPRVG